MGAEEDACEPPMTSSDLSVALLRPSRNTGGLLPGICGASWSQTSLPQHYQCPDLG